MALVLTTNEVILDPDLAWDDVEGVHYHYPNQYKNKVRTGEPFVYYRGVHRRAGSAPAEYFGAGRVGRIWRDPRSVESSRPNWFCSIENYVPFAQPVQAKTNGSFYELGPPNLWRNGVRLITPVVLDQILSAAGLPSDVYKQPSSAQVPKPETVLERDDLVIPPTRAGTRSGQSGFRKSKRAKQIGDWAERVALSFIQGNLPNAAAVTHRAAISETPGWDIDYQDVDGLLQRIEVKGTVGAAFQTVELTAKEMSAAKEHGDNYWIYLVARCLTPHPFIQRLRNPAKRLEAKSWVAVPALFTVRLG